ncbi:translation initiation factor IF-2-like [Meles meles]|uniref:translation initiation factor IF-2-like n=1 Tax=Meles meles TaxID=9662 RepID=UPI001E69DAF3|nr:translation initiation factor IF-2-like [Meles meles]XP_045878758.1 translation initiation factor IF-2-like [Meles meles]
MAAPRAPLILQTAGVEEGRVPWPRAWPPLTPCPGVPSCSRWLEGRQARRLPRPASRLSGPGKLLCTPFESRPTRGPPHLRSPASCAFVHRAQEPTRGAVSWAPPDVRAHTHPQSPLGSPATTETRHRAGARLTPQELEDTCGAAGPGADNGTAAMPWTGREGPARPSPQDTHGASEHSENAAPRGQVRGHPKQAHRQRASGHARAGARAWREPAPGGAPLATPTSETTRRAGPADT